VLVDVEGKVRRPGLYRLPNGARVADALAAAGGARPRVSTVSLNLAARVTDGQQVVVGSAGSPAAPGSPVAGGGATSSTAPAPVSLNAATLEQLETLPGVGPVLAQHILDWRAEHGGFASVDQLNDVSGIGDITFANLHDLVTL
jgi:competence protein ComEA